MTVFSILAGLACGVLSGLGVGGGSLLMVYMTAVLSMEQQTARTINLLYFLPTAAGALVFHLKNKQLYLGTVLPAAGVGCLAAVAGSLLSYALDPGLLRRFFGLFLLIVGAVELRKKK